MLFPAPPLLLGQLRVTERPGPGSGEGQGEVGPPEQGRSGLVLAPGPSPEYWGPGVALGSPQTARVEGQVTAQGESGHVICTQ